MLGHLVYTLSRSRLKRQGAGLCQVIPWSHLSPHLNREPLQKIQNCTKINTHLRTKLFPKPVFSASWCSIELFARVLAWDVERDDSKVPLGIAPPLVAWAYFEIKCPNILGVQASVFYSKLSYCDPSHILSLFFFFSVLGPLLAWVTTNGVVYGWYIMAVYASSGRDFLHTSQISHLLLYLSLWLLVPGLSSQFLPIQPVFNVSSGHQYLWEMATRFCRLREPLSDEVVFSIAHACSVTL